VSSLSLALIPLADFIELYNVAKAAGVAIIAEHTVKASSAREELILNLI
jgi:hypothetical protein